MAWSYPEGWQRLTHYAQRLLILAILGLLGDIPNTDPVSARVIDLLLFAIGCFSMYGSYLHETGALCLECLQDQVSVDPETEVKRHLRELKLYHTRWLGVTLALTGIGAVLLDLAVFRKTGLLRMAIAVPLMLPVMYVFYSGLIHQRLLRWCPFCGWGRGGRGGGDGPRDPTPPGPSDPTEREEDDEHPAIVRPTITRTINA